MGCATSKPKPVCKNCRAPITRSYSMHVHHPPQTEGDTYHLVALKSSTLGYLQLDPSNPNHHQQPVPQTDDTEFAVGVIDAKTWSKMIEEKIPKLVPKTPVTTPPGEPETINAWELMEGLDDTSPLRPKATTNHVRSFSFHVNPSSFTSSIDNPSTVSPENTHRNNNNNNMLEKPMCLQTPDNTSESNSIISSNDTSVSSEFRKSLELLSTENPFYIKQSVEEKEVLLDGNDGCLLDITNYDKSLQNSKVNSLPRVKEKVVLYFTSLRGVRKTYEDCCHVRHLLKATGVRVDERDVSMHSGFKDELKELLGGFIGGLPKVFIGAKCIGGAMEIRRLHEDGELEKAVERCEMAGGGGDGGCGGYVGGCEACGDIRFVPCETCSGSCKIYYEEECDESDYEEQEGGDYGFQRCPDCNENGLVRCPICCD